MGFCVIHHLWFGMPWPDPSHLDDVDDELSIREWRCRGEVDGSQSPMTDMKRIFQLS